MEGGKWMMLYFVIPQRVLLICQNNVFTFILIYTRSYNYIFLSQCMFIKPLQSEVLVKIPLLVGLIQKYRKDYKNSFKQRFRTIWIKGGVVFIFAHLYLYMYTYSLYVMIIGLLILITSPKIFSFWSWHPPI